MDNDEILKSNAWCAPSQSLWDMFHLPMPDLIYPDDCGQPHKWERMAINDSQCQCCHCGDGVTRWLECSECLTNVHEKDDPEGFEALWEPAPWG